MRPRDSQRQRLYDAENDCFGRSSYYVGDLGECREFVNKVWTSSWTTKHYRIVAVTFPPDVTDGRGARRAYGSRRRISLPLWTRSKWIILHEIAHGLMIGFVAAHGREFAACYLALVQHFLGKDDAELLKMSFKQYHVKYRPKKKLSEDALAELRKRGRALAAAKIKRIET